MIDVAWRSLETDSIERLRLTSDLELRAVSMISQGEQATRYEVVLGSDWRVRSLEVESTQGGSLHLVSDGQGGWTVGGHERPDLTDAVDLDFVLTPFTNSLPIHRLALEVGASAEITVAWVDFPSLEVAPAAQRYTRLAEREWRFESLDGDFTRDITVDEKGLVVDYPGLFERVDGTA